MKPAIRRLKSVIVLLIKQHNSQSKQTYEGLRSNNHNNNKDRNVPKADK